MNPLQKELERDKFEMIKTILEEVRIIKEYILEIRKAQNQRIKQGERKTV